MTALGARRRFGALERGQGLFSLVGALVVFFSLLLFAVQLSLTLSSRSAVTASAFDAARDVAGYDAAEDRVGAARRAEARLRRLLGRHGEDAEVTWDLTDPARVRLRIVVASPTVAPRLVLAAAGLAVTDRTITVHLEQQP